MTAYDSIQELRDLYAALEARVAKLEAAAKQYRPPTQEEIVQAEYGASSWQPTERMLNFAKDISAALGHNTDFSNMTRQEVGEYISRYKSQYYRTIEQKRDAARMKPLMGDVRS